MKVMEYDSHLPARNRGGRLTAALAAALVWVCAVVSAGNAQGQDQAQQAGAFIQSLADEAVAALTQPTLSRDERMARSRSLLNDHFAVPAIGRWVLGRYWRTATPEERQTYLKLFEDLIVVTYVDRFQRYSGEKLSVTRTILDQASGDALVYSEIARPGAAQPLQVSWRVRPSNGGFKVLDVFVEGVSQGQTQRAEFTATLNRSQGNMEALFAEMRKRIAQQS